MIRIIVIFLLVGATSASACMHCAWSAVHTMQIATIVATSPIPLFVQDDSEVLTKPSNATRELSHETWSLFVDSTVWRDDPDGQNPYSSVQLMHKDGGAFVGVLYFPMQMIVDDLVTELVTSLESMSGCKATLVSKRTSNVNGVDVTDVVVKYECKDVSIMYNNLYYSDSKRTVVLMSWAGSSTYEKLRLDMRQAASGLMIRK